MGTPGDAEPVDEAQRQQSLERVRDGGLPLRAEQRLKDLADHRGFYTSDLSVAEFALCQQAGLRPISQVMGSSVYHVGFNYVGGYNYAGAYNYGAQGFEVAALAEAWNNARERALSRLRQEAQHCGADAVVGLHIDQGRWDFVAGAIEFVAIGTAVRHQGERPNPVPVLTDLSVQDYYKLRCAGHEALGIVGGTTVYYVIPSYQTQRVQSTRLFGPGSQNQELPEFTQGLYTAREIALSHVESQARTLGAAGVVGVDFDQHERTIEIDLGGGKRQDLEITLHVLGTAIGAEGSAPASALRRTTLRPVLSLTRNTTQKGSA
jgi:uncharacterized protein YbjQ (UPF0145 family)